MSITTGIQGGSVGGGGGGGIPTLAQVVFAGNITTLPITAAAFNAQLGASDNTFFRENDILFNQLATGKNVDIKYPAALTANRIITWPDLSGEVVVNPYPENLVLQAPALHATTGTYNFGQLVYFDSAGGFSTTLVYAVVEPTQDNFLSLPNDSGILIAKHIGAADVGVLLGVWTIAHGLSFTPTFANIIPVDAVTGAKLTTVGAGRAGGYGLTWDATNIYVTANNPAAAGNINIMWVALQ